MCYLPTINSQLLCYCRLIVLGIILILSDVTSQKQNNSAAAVTKNGTKPCPDDGSEKKIICYTVNWASYRTGKGEFTPKHIDPFLCTHIVYVWARLNETTLLTEFSDPWADLGKHTVLSLTNLKITNPKLKVLLGLGGWTESSPTNYQKYSSLFSSPAKRSAFNEHVKNFLETYKFDGLDLNLQYPAFPQGTRNVNAVEADRKNFAVWVSELKAVLQCNLLTSVVAANPEVAKDAYDRSIYEHLDWVGVLSFDYYGSWFKNTGYAFPLYSGAGVLLSCDDSINHFLNEGCPPEKLIFGIRAGGRTFTLDDPQQHGIGAPASGPGLPGPYTAEAGLLAYYEIVDQNWTLVANDEFGLYGYRGNQWVSFDDPHMVKRKAEYAQDRMKLGGILISFIDMDTFQAQNGAEFGPYDITRSVKNVFDSAGKNSTSQLPLILGISSSLAVLLLLSFCGLTAGLLVYRRKVGILKSRLRELTQTEVDEFFDGSSEIDSNDINARIHAAPFDKKFLLEENQLAIARDQVLGSGQFGVVLIGSVTYGHEESYSSEPLKVAVKTVKPSVDVLYFKALLSELKIMAYLGKHDNIASLIGAQTEKIVNRMVYIAIEFCPKGDLLRFLQKNRAGARFLLTYVHSESQAPGRTENVYTDSTPLLKSSKRQKTQDAIVSDEEVEEITAIHLLQWARQIASGMAFLTTKKVIHGDLAARNVLLTSERVAKISDFGLSRQLLNYNNYTKTTVTPLPWRWMAIESLQNMDFSVQSDVWSYGVTMWEIFSLGETPYLGSNSWDHEFVEKLSAGKLRLHSPPYAEPKVYNLMLECWRKNPMDRISFESMSAELYEIMVILTRAQSQEYLKLL